jgi:Ceramidase
MNGISRSSYLTAGGLTLASAIGIIALLGALGPDWSVYAPATCTTTRCFCELPRIGMLIVQPANSWSSYGYAFAGFLMIVLARGQRWTSGFPAFGAVTFGATAIFVGLGSVLLHATLTLWGQFFDVLGMYLVSGFMLVGALAKARGLSNRQAVMLYLGVVGALALVLLAMPEVRRWLYGVVLIIAIILELGIARPLRPSVQTPYYFFGIAAKATAFTIWNLDQRGIVCAPQSLVQGHAIWHLLGALALWCTFLYYRSERPAGLGAMGQ